MQGPFLDYPKYPEPVVVKYRYRRLIVGVLTVVGWAVVIYLAAVAYMMAAAILTAAQAHDAPSGWSYPFSCCSNTDCREAPEGTIGETPAGYLYKLTGDTVKYQGDARLRRSPDGRFHICTVAGELKGRTLCLFAPPRSF